MSLEQDDLGESKSTSTEGRNRKRRIVQADVEHSYALAREKERMGIPLNEKDRHALKTGRLIEDLKKEAK